MEALDMAACFEDNLLDFASDVGEEDEDKEHNKKSSTSSSSLNPNNSCFSVSTVLTWLSFRRTRGAIFRVRVESDPGREFAEEELEWLSNKDAFPAVETSFVDVLGTATKHQSSLTLANGNVVMYCFGNIKIPVKARSKRLRKCRDLRDHEKNWRVHENVKTSNATAKGNRWRTMGRKCQHCGAEKTPQWRAGPLGPKTLCNACGVRYKSGRLVPEYRPASSPTFSSRLHSNSHRKILEMRRHKQLGFPSMKPMDKR
ncbi:hypothetical protein GOBAR_AA03477 [Gossypium barbadense]|uniref:GATA-type domain-containing protein n=1 Tax=Gossypium barbadense TaxID=3634 RepID=A0A2P5YNF9_GOSBA|nr:hypothetical protein GOBAR_AA03477 [Gossypium barbadense]